MILNDLKKDCEFAKSALVLAGLKQEISNNLPDILFDLPKELENDAQLTMTKLANFDPNNVTAENYSENMQIILELGGKMDTLTRNLPPEQKAANRKCIDTLIAPWKKLEVKLSKAS